MSVILRPRALRVDGKGEFVFAQLVGGWFEGADNFAKDHGAYEFMADGSTLFPGSPPVTDTFEVRVGDGDVNGLLADGFGYCLRCFVRVLYRFGDKKGMTLKAYNISRTENDRIVAMNTLLAEANITEWGSLDMGIHRIT